MQWSTVDLALAFPVPARGTSIVCGLVVYATLAGLAACDRLEQPAHAGNASAGMEAVATPQPGVCGSMDGLSETFDPSGTPLVFSFSHPAGFVVRRSKVIEDVGFKLDLALESGGPNDATISVMQLDAPIDSPTPVGIPTAAQVAHSPALRAMGGMVPKPAETIEFNGRQVETFRSVTDTKVIYKFNLPVDGRYRTVDVHFFPPDGPDNCVPAMAELATAWVHRLEPKRQSAPGN